MNALGLNVLTEFKSLSNGVTVVSHVPPVPLFIIECLLDAWPEPIGKLSTMQAIWEEDIEPSTANPCFKVHLNRARKALKGFGYDIETVRPDRMDVSQSLLMIVDGAP